MIWFALLLGSFGSLFLLWILWIIVAGLSRASQERRLSPLITHVGVTIAAVGLAYDVLCNVLICSFLFLDFP